MIQISRLFPSFYRRIWPFLKRYQRQVWISSGALVLAAATVLSLGYGLRVLVDSGFGKGEESLLNQGVLGLLAASLLLALAAYVRTSTTAWLGEKVAADLKMKLFRHLLNLDQTFFEEHKVGSLLSRLDGDTALIRSAVSASAAVAFRSVLQALGAVTLLIMSSPKLSLFVGAVIPLILSPIAILGKKVKAYSWEAQNRQAHASGLSDEVLSAMSTVQAFRAEERFFARYLGAMDSYFEVIGRRIRARSSLIALVIGLSFSAISFVLWMGGRDVLAGNLSAGELSKFIFYAVVAAGSLNNLGDVLGELNQASGALDHIYDLLYVFPQVRDAETTVPLKLSEERFLAFESVTFSYPSRPDTPALKDLSFCIREGEKIALVGPSGAGKSTIFHLLLRFYEARSGHIYFGEADIRALSLGDLRRQFAYVSQNPAIFNTTLHENLTLGEVYEEEKVLEACRQAHLLSFIETLPAGFGTLLGEKGVRLSGGQRQRLALARALLLDAPVLLLDEATSALDAESEYEVQKALEEAMKGKTTLIIAHRLSTILKSDRILVLDRGRLVEEGTHKTLLKEKGLYAALAEKQLLT